MLSIGCMFSIVSRGCTQGTLSSSNSHFKMAAVKEVYKRSLVEAKKTVERRWPGFTATQSFTEDFDKVSEWALKRNLERAREKYKFDLIQSFPIVKLKRELDRLGGDF